MKLTWTIFAAGLCVALVNSLPVSEEGFKSQALDQLMVVEADDDAALRSKRTIGLLRQLFPDVTKMIEDKVNMILGEVLKVVGPVLFQTILGNRNGGGGGGGLFGGGGGGSSTSSDAGSTVMAKNPFDDDDDDKGIDSFVDDDEFFSRPKDEGTKISIDLPAVDSADEISSTSATIEETTVSSTESVTANTIE